MGNIYNPDWIIKLNDIYAALIQLEGQEAATKKYKEAIHNRVVEIMGLYASHVVPLSSCVEAIQIIKDKAIAEGDNELCTDILPKETNEDCQEEDGVAPYTINDLVIPQDIDSLPTLAVNMRDFQAPRTVDLRDYCIKTEDQKSNPWCAAYAAAGFASNINWRKHDTITEYNIESIYKAAKQIDGTTPTTEGTTLTAVLEVLLMKGIFDSSKCQTKVIRNLNQIKYAIHKFGCCLLGIMVTREWYKCNKNKSTISGKYDKEILGGHAVLCCGYNQDGAIIQNPWGVDWGSYGFALITWDELERTFGYGSVLNNCLYDTKMN